MSLLGAPKASPRGRWWWSASVALVAACDGPPMAPGAGTTLASSTVDPSGTTTSTPQGDAAPSSGLDAEPGVDGVRETEPGASDSGSTTTTSLGAGSGTGSEGTATDTGGGSSDSGGDPVAVPCTSHDDCPASACHLDGPDVGTCFEPSQVTSFGGTDAELVALLTSIPPLGQQVVRLVPGTEVTVTDGVVLQSDVELALIGSPGSVIGAGCDGAFCGSIHGQATILYLDELELGYGPLGASLSLYFEDGSIWVEDTEMFGTMNGILAVGGRGLHVLRSLFHGAGTSVSAVEEVIIEGSVIHGGNLALACGASVVRITNSAIEAGSTIGLDCNSPDLLITYSTLVGHVDEALCMGTGGIVRNSILVGDVPPASAPSCSSNTLEHDAIDDGGPGGTNVLVGPYSPGWFVDPTTGDFHLDPLQLGIPEAALRQPGDPLVDVDGDPIPAGPSYPGYDQP